MPISGDKDIFGNDYSGGTYVGVPEGYAALKSFDSHPSVSTINYPGYAGYGTVTTANDPVYKAPIYKQADLYSLAGKPPGQVFQIQMALYGAGYLKSGFQGGTFDEKTYKALQNAMGDANRNGESLQEMFGRTALGQLAFKKGGSSGSGGGGGGGGGGGPRTIVSKSVSLTGRAGAQAALANVLANELGRFPTPQEVGIFQRSLNSAEKASPTITTTHISAGGSSQSSVTKQSDVDPSQQAIGFGQRQRPREYKAFQDSQYLDVIAKMLGI